MVCNRNDIGDPDFTDLSLEFKACAMSRVGKSVQFKPDEFEILTRLLGSDTLSVAKCHIDIAERQLSNIRCKLKELIDGGGFYIAIQSHKDKFRLAVKHECFDANNNCVEVELDEKIVHLTSRQSKLLGALYNRFDIWCTVIGANEYGLGYCDIEDFGRDVHRLAQELKDVPDISIESVDAPDDDGQPEIFAYAMGWAESAKGQDKYTRMPGYNPSPFTSYLKEWASEQPELHSNAPRYYTPAV